MAQLIKKVIRYIQILQANPTPIKCILHPANNYSFEVCDFHLKFHFLDRFSFRCLSPLRGEVHGKSLNRSELRIMYSVCLERDAFIFDLSLHQTRT